MKFLKNTAKEEEVFKEGNYRIILKSGTINDLITKRAYKVYSFRLFNNGKFVCKFDVADCVLNDNIEIISSDVIEILKKKM